MYPHLLLTLHIYYAPRYTHVVSLSQCLCFSLSFLKNGPTPASFSFIFGLFQTNYTILTANKWEKMSIEYRCQDLNPRPLEQESIPTTTRTGIPPSLSHPLKQTLTLSAFSTHTPHPLYLPPFFIATLLHTTTNWLRHSRRRRAQGKNDPGQKCLNLSHIQQHNYDFLVQAKRQQNGRAIIHV